MTWRQAIIRTNHNLVYWRIYVSLGPNELGKGMDSAHYYANLMELEIELIFADRSK